MQDKKEIFITREKTLKIKHWILQQKNFPKKKLKSSRIKELNYKVNGESYKILRNPRKSLKKNLKLRKIVK